jgi:hypothetical protein
LRSLVLTLFLDVDERFIELPLHREEERESRRIEDADMPRTATATRNLAYAELASSEH